MNASGGEILRGMQVEPQPLRIGRVRERALPQAAPEEDRGAREAAALQEARMEAERVGHEEGLRKGLADATLQVATARKQAEAKAQAALHEDRKKLAAVLASLAAAMDEAMQLTEDDMVALCFETVCKIVADRALQPDAVRAQVRMLMAQITDRRDMVLRLHPQDVELLRRCQEPTGEEVSELHFVPDADVLLGGCILQHARGGIDARLESLLCACKDALLATRKRLASGGGWS